jgi:hypothetical protein
MSSNTNQTYSNKHEFGIITTFSFENFQIFDKNEIHLHSGINIIKTSPFDKNLFKYLIKCCLNPDYYLKQRNIDKNLYNLMEEVKIDSKKPINVKISFFINQKENFSFPISFKDYFIMENKLQLKYEFSSDKRLQKSIFNWKKNVFENASPRIEFYIVEFLYSYVWMDKTIFPNIDMNFLSEMMKFSPSQFFNFLVSLCNLKTLKETYFDLKDQINILILEKNNVNLIKDQAEDRKLELENKKNLLDQIKVIEKKIDELHLEQEWAPFYELKNIAQGKITNNEKISKQIENLKLEKENLEHSTLELDDSLNGLLQIQANINLEYENVRKKYLGEKALSDRLERSLKDWEASVAKTEKEIKFKNMKLVDKDKKLRDLESRLAKDNSENLSNQKQQVEMEIKSIQKELSNLQENLTAIQNERNIKIKEKNIKEKLFQSLTVNLSDLTSKLQAISINVEKKEKEKNQVELSLNKSISLFEKLEIDKEVLEKEIKDLFSKIESGENEIKQKKLDKPVQQRSLSTINVLLNQLLFEKQNLEKKVGSDIDSNLMREHTDFMNSLDSEFVKRGNDISELDVSLSIWKTQWELTFKDCIKELFNISNYLLKDLFSNIELESNFSLLPDEGASSLFYSVMNGNKIIKNMIWFDTLASFQLIISIIFSSVLVSKHNFFIFDLLELEFFAKENLKTILERFFDKYNVSGNKSDSNFSQVILFIDKDLSDKIPEIKKYSV